MNRRGFLAALTTAAAGTAAAAVPSAAASAPPRSHEVVLGRRVRHPAHLEWKLPRDFSLEDIQKCIDKVASIDRRLVIVSAELGDAALRRRYVALVEREGHCCTAPGALIPLYINETLGSRGLRFNCERRSQ